MLTPELRVAALRDLSYLCNMAQWGSLPITGDRRDLYRQCRDFYIEAETLAFGPAYRRLGVLFEGSTYHANLHIAPQLAPGRLAGLAVIVHAIDGSKEKHFPTYLVLV